MSFVVLPYNEFVVLQEELQDRRSLVDSLLQDIDATEKIVALVNSTLTF
jgi:hypothetical protein